MAPIQILTNNMLYDFSQVPIPNDAVDDELVARPRPWNIGEIKRFILCIGPISSIFDYTTFFVMLYLRLSSFISFARIKFLSSRAVQAGRC
jgi:Mg2+-importing ATPase